MEKVQAKANINGGKTLFIVKCSVVAAMKRMLYDVYIHLDQTNADMYYAKCSCKAGPGGCCKHVAAVLYQLVDYKELDVKSVPPDKTCTEVLQQWHVPGEKQNSEAVLFSELTFEKQE